MKLPLDMNMSPRRVELLNGPAYEAVHWSSLGAANEADHEIMAYAKVYGYVVLMNDLDFGIALFTTNAALPSVVQVRFDNLDPHVIQEQIAEVLRGCSAELEQGALVSVDSKKTRVRLLPLRLGS